MIPSWTKWVSFITLILVITSHGIESRGQVAGQKSGHPVYQFASRLINQVAEEQGLRSIGNQQNIYFLLIQSEQL